MKKFSSWLSGNQPGKQPRQSQTGRPKKNVHWKSAERPSPPGQPILIPISDQQPDVVTLKWERPKLDGGSPITSYIIEHRRMGSPHWVRSTPAPVTGCEVSISGLEPGWRYQFRAIAENVVGKSDPSELSDPLTVTLQRNAISVPRFVSELTDMSVVENERVEFRVSVLGQPQPEISWFKDGYEIFSSRRTKIVNDNEASVLIIHQVALTDEGEIKCTATNRAGHVVTKAKLMVEAPPKIRLPRNYEDGLIVEADEVLRLKVGIAGQPPPSVVWLHEGETIPNTGRHELVTTDKNSSLKIDNVKRKDRGEYSIKAVNKLGEDSTSFLVTVTSRPNPPGKVRLNTSYGKSATLSWTSPEDDGGCKIGNYIVEYFRIGWNVWLKAATTRQLSTTLNDLIEGSEYKFRVKAENPYGLSDPGEESDVLFIPDPKRGMNEPNAEDKNKPVPPRRKTLSPQRALPDGEEEGGTRSPKLPSPLPDRKKKPQILDSEDLHREMSYGTNLSESHLLTTSNQIDVPPIPIENSSTPQTPEMEEKLKLESNTLPRARPNLAPLTLQRTTTPSLFPIKPAISTSPSLIAPALGPVLTSALAPVLRFSPSSAVTPPPLPTPPSAVLRTASQNATTSSKAKSSKGNLSNQDIAKERKMIPKSEIEPAVSNVPSMRIRSLSPKEVRSSPPRSPTPMEQHVRMTPPRKQTERNPSPMRSFSPTERSSRVIKPPKNKSETPEPHPSLMRKRSLSPKEQSNRFSSQRKQAETSEARSSLTRLRDFSPIEQSSHRTPQTTPPEVKKTSQALQRSEEPIDLDVNQRVQRYSNRGFTPEINDEFKRNEDTPNPTIEISGPGSDPVPFSDTDRRDDVHTSNEFMLVLFHKNSKVKDNEKQDSFDLDLEEALQPPPISISSPDLASMEFSNLHSFPLRRSVSSTELLYERAMARFYEAVEMEEAEKARKMKLSQEKLSVQATTVRKRLSSISEAERLSFERRCERRRQSTDIVNLVPNNSKWDSSDSIHNRVPLAQTRGTLNQISQETDDGSDYRGQTGESFDVESDYTASTDSVSEDSIEKFKRELASRTRAASTELETYHPRSMTAGVFTPYRSPTPEQSAIVLNRPVPLASPDFVPKPILKRPSNESVLTDESPIITDTPSSATVLKNMQNEKSEKGKGFKSFFKWDKKTPTEKNTEANAEPPLTEKGTDPVESAAEAKRKSKEEEERQKAEADRIFQEEAKVVADHYGDIVRQVGSTKKYNPPLYLNQDELKKVAEKAAQESGIRDEEEFNPSSQHFETLQKPRLSLIERHQIQHVSPKPSRLSMKTPEKYEPSEEDEATPSSASQPSQRSESRGRKKIIKVKKIVKKRVASATRSRDPSSTSSRPPSSLTVPVEEVARKPVLQPQGEPMIPKKRPISPLPQRKVIEPSTSLVIVPQKSPDEMTQEAEEKVRSALSYMTDVCLFIAACYVYLFKDARLVLPILALMVYRQLGEAIRNSIPEWMKKKRQ